MRSDIILTGFRTNKIVLKALELLTFFIVFIMAVIPIAWGLATSLKARREIFLYPPTFFGFELSFEHYKNIFSSGFLLGISNSLVYAGSSIVVGVIIGILAGYAFQRCKFPLKKLLFYFVVAGIPLATGSSILLIPNYLVMSKINLIDKWFTLVIIYTAYNLPMAIWIIRGGIESIPIEIEEAAIIDGCSRSYIIFILSPRLILPSIASAALFIFIGSWNEFIVSSVMINSPNLRSIQQVIYYFMGFFGTDWGALCASSCMAILPILIVFTLLVRLMVSGLTQGAVKG